MASFDKLFSKYDRLVLFDTLVRIGAAHFLEAAKADIAAGQRRSGIANRAKLHFIFHMRALHLAQTHLAKLFGVENVVKIAAGAFDQIHVLFLLMNPANPAGNHSLGSLLDNRLLF